MKKIVITSVALLMTLIVSCEKTDLTESQSVKENSITVVNGRLKFVDENHFNQTMKYLQSNESEEFLNKWENQYVGYQSSRTMFNAIAEKDIEKIATKNALNDYQDYLTLVPDYDGEDKIATKQIPDNATGTLFNREGLVLIGNDAYKYTLDKLVKFTDFTDDELLKYRNNIPSNKISYSVIEKVSLKQKSARIAEISNAEHCTNYVTSGERFAADYNLYKCSNTGGLSFNCVSGENNFRRISVTALFQKRFLGIWYTATPYSIRRNGLVNNILGLNIPTVYNEPNPLQSTLDYTNGIIVNNIWVSVAGKRKSSDTEVTCTCGTP